MVSKLNPLEFNALVKGEDKESVKKTINLFKEEDEPQVEVSDDEVEKLLEVDNGEMILETEDITDYVVEEKINKGGRPKGSTNKIKKKKPVAKKKNEFIKLKSVSQEDGANTIMIVDNVQTEIVRYEPDTVACDVVSDDYNFYGQMCLGRSPSLKEQSEIDKAFMLASGCDSDFDLKEQFYINTKYKKLIDVIVEQQNNARKIKASQLADKILNQAEKLDVSQIDAYKVGLLLSKINEIAMKSSKNTTQNHLNVNIHTAEDINDKKDILSKVKKMMLEIEGGM